MKHSVCNRQLGSKWVCHLDDVDVCVNKQPHHLKPQNIRPVYLSFLGRKWICQHIRQNHDSHITFDKQSSIKVAFGLTLFLVRYGCFCQQCIAHVQKFEMLGKSCNKSRKVFPDWARLKLFI